MDYTPSSVALNEEGAGDSVEVLLLVGDPETLGASEMLGDGVLVEFPVGVGVFDEFSVGAKVEFPIPAVGLGDKVAGESSVTVVDEFSVGIMVVVASSVEATVGDAV